MSKISTEEKAIWPNFFIGVEKSGTSSLYEYLREVPGICMSLMYKIFSCKHTAA